MHFTALLSLLAAATLVNAAPSSPRAILKRANPSPVSCGPPEDQRAWPLESIQDSFNAFTTYGNLPNPQKPAAGTRYYPRQYGNNQAIPSDPDVVTALNAIPECVTGQTGVKFYEFPITDPIFAGGDEASQGPDRVIAIAANVGPGGTRTFTYCLAITHRGGSSPSDPSFRPCAGV